jgi:hypothetical protein
MTVIPIKMDIKLSDDRLLDIIVLQWWTPMEGGPRCFGVLPQDMVGQKAADLQKLGTWLIERLDSETPTRPVFVIAPEVSCPASLLPQLDTLISRLQRPSVFIVGLCHVTAAECNQLLHNWHTPIEPDWTVPTTGGQMINAAAILIKAAGSNQQPQRFLQPKIFPYRDENPQLFRGTHSLMFYSENQTSGSRINFSVKICSDFVNADAVRQFRHDVEEEVPGRPLDFTFVLQHQDDPKSVQIQQSIQAYFDAPDKMVNTSEGALIFSNTASERRGRSTQFAGSGMHVKFVQKFPMSNNTPSPTCFREERPPYDHQAILLRECGPSIYRLTIKPVYLRNRIPGQADEQAFQLCECALLSEAEPALNFRRLEPVSHWLDSEWREDETAWLDSVAPAVDPYRSFLQTEHRLCREMWLSSFSQREVEARDNIQKYTVVLEGYEAAPRKQPEPFFWNEQTSTACRVFMRSLTLLRIGLSAPYALQIPTDRLNVRHAMLGNDTALTLLWGNGDQDPKALLGRFAQLHREYGVGEFLGRQWVIMLVNPAFDISPEDFDDLNNCDITAPAASTGDVVRVAQKFVPLCTSTLWRASNRCSDGGTLRSRIEPALKDIYV